MSDKEEIEKRVEAEVERRLRDPGYLQTKMLVLVRENAELKGENAIIYENRDDYSMARVAEHLQIPYLPENEGKSRVMGQNILHLLFEAEGIIVSRGAEGYRMSKAYQDRGYGHTKSHYYQTKAGQTRVTDHVVFSGKGLELLTKKYKDDNRLFRMERWAGYARLVIEE